jgi:energy-coupling factor transporter ATP-binding protein EcfA2
MSQPDAREETAKAAPRTIPIRSIVITGFRGVRTGRVENLSALSVLVGPNNCGKSTVLEAIAAVGSASDARAAFELLLRRGGATAHALQSVFHSGVEAQLSTPEAVNLPTMTQLGIREVTSSPLLSQSLPTWECTVTARYSTQLGEETSQSTAFFSPRRKSALASAGHFPFVLTPVRFVDVEAIRATGSLEDAYTRIEKAGRLPQVVRALRSSMSELSDLRILKVNDDFVLHTFAGGHAPVPAFLAGDGFKRLLNITATICDIDHGVVLLEEPESFQHPRYLRELAELLRAATARGTQVILSTHSIELIDLLLGSDEHTDEPWPTVHRLRLIAGELRSVTVSARDVRTLRHELVEDLRT